MPWPARRPSVRRSPRSPASRSRWSSGTTRRPWTRRSGTTGRWPPRRASRSATPSRPTPSGAGRRGGPVAGRAARSAASVAMATTLEAALDLVRSVPDFPEPGILFWDLTPVLADAGAMAAVADGLHIAHGGAGGADLVAAIEA